MTILPKTLVAKVNEYGAQQILKIIRQWERRKAQDKARYDRKRVLLDSLKRASSDGE